MHQPLPTPLYQRVFGVLHQRIRSGVYPVGQQLDTEQELAEQFGVSKPTIRQAVGELVQRGLVVRQQGRGTFVTEAAGSDPTPAFVGTLADLIEGTPRLKLHDTRIEVDVPFPHAVRSQLGMTGSTGTVIRTRRVLAGSELFSYSVHYLGASVTAQVTEKELGKTGLIALLHRKGVQLRTAEQSISAELADAEVARELAIDVGAATLAARRILYSVDGPVDVLHSWYRGDLYESRTSLAFSWAGDQLSVRVSGGTAGTP